MTTRDFCIKWLAYGLALLPVWLLELFVLSRYPFMGTKPMLLPLAAVAVAALEGPSGGAGFGLAVGGLFDASAGLSGFGVALLTAIGLGAGLLARYVLRQNLLGCFLCSVLALLLLDAFRILPRLLLELAAPQVLVTVAGKELLWSLCFVPPVYLIFRWVFDRVPKATVF